MHTQRHIQLRSEHLFIASRAFDNAGILGRKAGIKAKLSDGPTKCERTSQVTAWTVKAQVWLWR